MQSIAPIGHQKCKHALSYPVCHQQPIHDERIQVMFTGGLVGSDPEVRFDPTLNKSQQRQNHQKRSGRSQPLTSRTVAAIARPDATIDGIWNADISSSPKQNIFTSVTLALPYVACIGLELWELIIVANQRSRADHSQGSAVISQVH